MALRLRVFTLRFGCSFVWPFSCPLTQPGRDSRRGCVSGHPKEQPCAGSASGHLKAQIKWWGPEDLNLSAANSPVSKPAGLQSAGETGPRARGWIRTSNLRQLGPAPLPIGLHAQTLDIIVHSVLAPARGFEPRLSAPRADVLTTDTRPDKFYGSLPSPSAAHVPGEAKLRMDACLAHGAGAQWAPEAPNKVVPLAGFEPAASAF